MEPFIIEAISFCEQQLERLNNNSQSYADDDEQKFVSLAELNNKLTLKKSHSEKKEDLEINNKNCFFFYQALSGEPIYLHPLCMQILESEKGAQLPLTIEEYTVLETEVNPADWPEFLGHLPPASAPTMVEISMEDLVHSSTLKQF